MTTGEGWEPFRTDEELEFLATGKLQGGQGEGR